MERFDKASATALMASIEHELELLLNKNGLKLSRISGVTDGDSVLTVKLELQTEGGMSREAQTFTIQAGLYGLKPSDLGKHFRMDGREFSLEGSSPRASQRPLVVRDVRTGKRYRAAAEVVRRALKEA